MSYREFAPPSALANVIECVWTRIDGSRSGSGDDAHAKVRVQSIAPDGAMDIIATFFPDGELDETFVVGSMTCPQLATVGNQPVVGIRFLPGVGGSALKVNAAMLTDRHADIDDVSNSGTAIRDAFRALRRDASKAHAAHQFANSIKLHAANVPVLVRHAAQLLGRQFSPSRVTHVANELRISRQHLTRIFSAHAGLTPKRFAQICRVRALLAAAEAQQAGATEASTLRALRTREWSKREGSLESSTREFPLHPRSKPDSWSMLAAQFGYVDQSHLIAEVHEIIGQTPAAWQAAAGSNIPIVPVPVAPL